ncbi:metal-dependent hydrolase [Natrinema amylolyticum]|uniref:metal-dependent hydrolase n=1 Tax=Natrinema amylolyticum TaxID=2878679 RepID=UPI001CFB0E5D|nr:metal-dependent hydrolase [Natrinema amylolyticum]
MEGGRILFLTVAFATHAVVGVALARGFTGVGPRTGAWLGIVFGLLPDADFLFPADWGWPFVHRGLTHSPLFALTVVAGVYAVAVGTAGRRGRRYAGVRRTRATALAAAVAIGSHLLIDSLSPMGIQWLFPIRTAWSPGLDVHGVIATTLLWSVSLAILARRTDDLDGVSEWARDDDSARHPSK